MFFSCLKMPLPIFWERTVSVWICSYWRMVRHKRQSLVGSDLTWRWMDHLQPGLIAWNCAVQIRLLPCRVMSVGAEKAQLMSCSWSFPPLLSQIHSFLDCCAIFSYRTYERRPGQILNEPSHHSAGVWLNSLDLEGCWGDFADMVIRLLCSSLMCINYCSIVLRY